MEQRREAEVTPPPINGKRGRPGPTTEARPHPSAPVVGLEWPEHLDPTPPRPRKPAPVTWTSAPAAAVPRRFTRLPKAAPARTNFDWLFEAANQREAARNLVGRVPAAPVEPARATPPPRPPVAPSSTTARTSSALTPPASSFAERSSARVDVMTTRSDPWNLAPLVTLLGGPPSVRSHGVRTPSIDPWRNRGRSADALIAFYAQLDATIANFIARQIHAATFTAPAAESSLRQQIDDIFSVPDLDDIHVPTQLRRAAPAFLATAVITGALLFSGSQSSAMSASVASSTRTADTNASRGATAEVPTTPSSTPAVLPADTTPPTTAAPAPTTAPPPPPTTAAPKGWAFPVANARLSSAFGYRIHPKTGRYSFHEGIDYAAPYGTDIHVVADGVVTEAGTVSGYGKYTCVRHDDKTTSCYGHQSSILVKKDQRVTRGQVIGKVGSTGTSTGNHLHFEVRKNGKAVNPAPFL